MLPEKMMKTIPAIAKRIIDVKQVIIAVMIHNGVTTKTKNLGIKMVAPPRPGFFFGGSHILVGTSNNVEIEEDILSRLVTL